MTSTGPASSGGPPRPQAGTSLLELAILDGSSHHVQHHQEARQRALQTVALAALCFHNSPHVELPPAFTASARVLAAKWPGQLPLVTPCAVLDHNRFVPAA